MTTKIICEGGASGHLAQIQELGEITFAEISDIFENVFSGNIELKEKIDGIALTVTMKNGDVYFSRNKSTLKNPMNVEDAIEFFSDRNANIRTTFTEAIHDLESALVQLDPEEQEAIFADGHNFINLEIVNVGATNIIDYGLSQGLLIFHGLQQFDDNWHQLNTDSSKAQELYDYLKSKDLLHQKSHDIEGPKVLKITNAMKASKALFKITRKLNKISKGYSSDTTLAEYVISKVEDVLKDHAPAELSQYINIDITKAIMSRSKHSMGLKLVDINSIADMFINQNDEINRANAKAFIKQCTTEIWFDDAIQKALDPIVDLVIEAGQLIIDCLSGFIAANPSETAKKLSDEMEKIIAQDNTADLTPGELRRYEAALKRLDKFNKQVNATEGIVFSYKGKIYKLTSTFGPLNQLIGLFKFRNVSESNKPVIESINSDQVLDSVLQANKNSKFVVYIRGSFKPPHVGHLEMIRKYSEMRWGKSLSITVMISDPKNAIRPLPNGQVITAEQAIDAMVFLINACNIQNVDAVESSEASPYDMIFDDITEDNFRNSKNKIIVLGISDKESDSTIEGFDNLINSILDELDKSKLDVTEWPKFVDPTKTTVSATTKDEIAVSATDFRNILGEITVDTPIMERIELVKPFLPKELNNEEVLDYLDILDIPSDKTEDVDESKINHTRK